MASDMRFVHTGRNKRGTISHITGMLSNLPKEVLEEIYKEL